MEERNPKNWKQYKLIDSGNFEKLEQYGQFVIRRPEPQAIWNRSMPTIEWEKITDAQFKKNHNSSFDDNNEKGEWISKKILKEGWSLSYPLFDKNLRFNLKMTSFKHLGIFPEQADNWDFIYKKIKESQKEMPNILNIFAYTGGASLAASAAGAKVTHVDSVKQVVNWAKENQDASNLNNIRWIVDDALKFVARENRRNNKYDGIILDPPAYGRGPKGEKWILAEKLPELLENCAAILDKNGFVVLNLYSMGYSSLIASNLLKQYFNKKEVECGELVITDNFGKKLPLSVFARG